MIVALVRGDDEQLPFTGVALNVPLMAEPERKPLVTLPLIVNLSAVEVAFSVIVPEAGDLALLLALALNVPDADPERHARLDDVILSVPLTPVAGGLPAFLQPVIENVAATL